MPSTQIILFLVSSSILLLPVLSTFPPVPSPCPCSDLPIPSLPGLTILSTNLTNIPGPFIIPAVPLLLPDPVTVPPICSISVSYTHAPLNDTVTATFWLPLQNWNGRLLALGGSGWAAGHGPLTLGPAVAQGFAAVATDAGLDGNLTSPAGWALQNGGKTVNHHLLLNFASRAVYEMTLFGKNLTAIFYGEDPITYWSGCSTGGRQGLVAAQQYPELFHGILAGAPAIHWPAYVVAELWPQVVMKEAGYYPSPEEFKAVVDLAVDACDELDGVKDGVIAQVDKCSFDPASVVGTVVDVGGVEVKITATLAAIVSKIWQGPVIDGEQLWYGLPIGSPLDTLAATTLVTNSTRAGLPFFVADTWIRYFVSRDPTLDISSTTPTQLKSIFLDSLLGYDDVLNNANPDLTRLSLAATKLLVWHGAADPIIFPQGTTQYYEHVKTTSSADIDTYFRYFLAPGVDHCAQGTTSGALPVDLLDTLIKWTEEGVAPEYLRGQTLNTGGAKGFSRKICRFPLHARYVSGDANDEKNYECAE